ncbi:tyrosine-protein phosphatase [Chitinophaga sp. RCC_12]|uniref:tyrosine-protein phosphatase n=1 Tax=Chitinophaga sp. RCC_12 TaxID=3239226 RepID=UPI00352520A4
MKRIMLVLAIALPMATFAQLADSAQRVVRMQGAVNFRDVGGYKTTDGKEVVWGKVFRSADVSHLTDQDLTVLEQKHIHTVIDFRGIKEAAAAPDHLLPKTDYLLCPAGSDSLPGAAQMGEIIKKGNFLEKFYGNTQYLGDRYKPLFQKLLVLPANESIMYHCTGGRDRTGMATALFLYALGVPQQTIEADFTASNVYLLPMNKRMFQGMQKSTGMDEETIRKALELKPELLHSLFNAIKGKYGTVENFFEKELGIGEKERAILKEKYTI